MKTKLMMFLAGVILLLALAACTTGSYSALNAIEKNTATSISMSHDKFSGYKSTTIMLKENEMAEVSVALATVNGNIGLAITHENGEAAYQGTDIPASSFTVKLDKSGKYTIKVTGENHKGSYSIAWKITQKE